MKNRLLFQLLRALWVMFAAAAAIALFYLTLPLTYPFLIGFFVALAMKPLVSLFERRLKSPRWLAVTGSLVVLVGGIGGMLTLIIIRIVSEMDRFEHSRFHQQEISLIQNPNPIPPSRFRISSSNSRDLAN